MVADAKPQGELSKIVKNTTFNKIISIESAGKPKAKAPTSSAGGLFQFLNATFYAEAQMYYPILLKGRTKAEVYALRFDPEIAIDCGVKFTEDNAKALGAGWTEGDLYLAHFLGVGTAKKVLRAAGSTPVAQCVTADAIRANKTILTGKTCAQVRKWAQTAMDTRWAKLGNPDWIAIWYHKDDNAPVPSLETIRANSGPLAHKVEDPDGHLADIDGNGIPDYQEDKHPAAAGTSTTPPTKKVTKDKPSIITTEGADTMVQGNPDVWLTQNVLKSMHYNTGKVDGNWGGMTAEAVAGFLNDRNLKAIAVPRSREEFDVIKADLLDEIAIAQDEQFVRPVSEERANATVEKVQEVAPEAKPARRGFFITVFGAVGSIGTAVYKSVEGWVGDAYSFFFDHSDKVPDAVKDPNKVWSFITGLPVGIWFVLIGGVLAFVALGNWQAFAKIREDVKTGMRK